MTTTSKFQTRPDYYTSRGECERRVAKVQSNLRYKGFTQQHFTAGDEEQFQQYRNNTINPEGCNSSIPVGIKERNINAVWDKYKDVTGSAVLDTFKYIFNKFKKGIFVQIRGGKLTVFLPFSKVGFVNEWYEHIHIDPSYGGLMNFLEDITRRSGYNFNPNFVHKNISEWYSNNCILRYDVGAEGDSNVGTVKNFLEVLCKERVVPDIEFFLNRRDFPILTRDGTEAYNNVWDGVDVPLVSYLYDKYIPIFSMCTGKRYADVAMPTYEDWARVQSERGIWFPKSCKDYSIKGFNGEWDKKASIAVFRGGSTGCGVTVETNPRLKVAEMSHKLGRDNGLLDAGITNWNLRPRKISGQKYLQTIDVDKLSFGLVNKLSPEEQSRRYKYIINIDGHVSAFRLSLELAMGSVILLVDSDWKMWFSNKLKPWVHYVPVKSDLSDLLDQIRWCQNNDEKCKEIVHSALEFYHTRLDMKGILDFMNNTLWTLKGALGNYQYNATTPLDKQLQGESLAVQKVQDEYPKGKDYRFYDFPRSIRRNYGILEGVRWVFNVFNPPHNQVKYIFSNKLGKVEKLTVSHMDIVVKTTNDPIKKREHLHESYVGLLALNEMLKYIPNFNFTFKNNKLPNGEMCVYTEYIEGETLFHYLISPGFNKDEFLLILVQLCLALKVAQERCGFVHYDLTPWNIMLNRTGKSFTFGYPVIEGESMSVTTNVIPVMIDFGKSHVIVEGIHHGYINLYRMSTIQDIFSLLVTSIDVLIKKYKNQKYLAQPYIEYLLTLGNFLTETDYSRTKFTTIDELELFITREKRYSNLIQSTKGKDLESRTPLDFINYIQTNMSKYNLVRDRVVVGLSGDAKKLDGGNPRQVFEYVLSSNMEERLKSYIDVFVRIKHCTLPQPTSTLFLYYAIQNMYTNLMSVKRDLIGELHSSGLHRPDMIKSCDDVLNFLDKLYTQLLTKGGDVEGVGGVVSGNMVSVAPYTKNSFLSPKKIEVMIQDVNNNIIDLPMYLMVVNDILVYEGKYKVTPGDRKKIKENFKDILDNIPQNMREWLTNVNMLTLRHVSRDVYSENINILGPKCGNVYLKVLEKLG